MNPFLRQLWEEQHEDQAEQLELPFTEREQIIVQPELFVCL
jgi:hypothetical protein